MKLKLWAEGMKDFFLVSFFIFFTCTISTAQGPGSATNPLPPDSSKNILWFFQNLSWTNPSTAISNKLHVGIHPEYLTELHSGSLIDSFQLPSPLESRKTYYWRVDEIDSSGISEGDIWLFTTREPFIPVFIDSFSTGLNNWTVNNDTCGWEIKNFVGFSYDLPPTAETYGVCTDNASCGGMRSVNTLILTNPPDLTNYTRVGVGWDQDLMLSGSTDSAYVEMSNDGGNSWTKIWERVGRSQRKSQEVRFLGFSWVWDIVLRFTSSFVNSQSWWAIDNFFIVASALAYWEVTPPSNLAYNLNVGDSLNVLLSWQAGGGIPSLERYRILRKLGDSLDQFAYFTIGETGLDTLTFLDNSVSENTEYSYRVEICEGPIAGWKSFPITLFTVPVPVELISFTASAAGDDVNLNWITATELNNSGFSVEKSQTSRDNNWNVIGFVPGHGTTTEHQYYSFKDESVSPGNYQYRLKQIDYDGTFEYSDIVEVEVGVPNKFKLEQNYPNPFNPSTQIDYSIKLGGLITLRVYDILGNEVATLVNEKKSAGYYSVNFNAASLPSGIYFYKLTSGNFTDTKKLILIK